jgi:hypothetical protein
MATKRRRAGPNRYEKVSATLEIPVLRMIRDRSANVSEFLNQAAKDKLYFERLREAEEELEGQGVPLDEALVERLRSALTSPRKRRRAARR